MIPTRIARLNANGSTDATFTPGTGLNAEGRCVAILPDGRYLVGGAFTQVAGIARLRMAVLTESGQISSRQIPANGAVYALLPQTDGKIIVGGAFSTLNGSARSRLARLRSDLTVEPVYNPNADGDVYALAQQADGKTLAGGDFATMGGTSRSRLARLMNDPAESLLRVVSASRVEWLRGGSLPEAAVVTFEVDTGSGYGALGGTLARIPGGWAVTGLSLSGSGTLRARAYPSAGHDVSLLETELVFDFVPVLQVSRGGETLASGGPLAFDSVQVGASLDITLALANIGLASLALSGTPKVALSGTNADQFSVVAQPSSPMAANTSQTVSIKFTPTTAGSKSATLTIASDDDASPFTLSLSAVALPGPGSRNEAFQPSVAGYTSGTYGPRVEALAVSTSEVWIGGAFATVNGLNRKGYARFSLAGVAQSQSGAGVNQYGINRIAQLQSGKWLIGGTFTSVNGVTRNRLARLNADGSLDTAFNISLNNSVNALLPLADGGVIVGGFFDTAGGKPRAGLFRIAQDGSIDLAWNPGSPGYVASLAVQPDGKILVGGNFQNIAGGSRINLARLNPDGTLDGTFDAGLTQNGAAVSQLYVDAGGKILYHYNGGLKRLLPDGANDGTFTEGTGVTADLCLQADGKIVEACSLGDFRIARKLSDGTEDTTFVCPLDVGPARGLAISPTGEIYVGGSVMAVGGQSLPFVKLINGFESAQSELTVVSPSTVQILRGGIAPEAAYVVFDFSANGTQWDRLALGMRMPGGWQATGLNLPTSGRVRARLFIPSGQGSGAYQDVQVTYSGLPVPDIRVQYPLGTEIADNGTLRMPGQIPGQTGSIELKIENTGLAPLSGLAITSNSPEYQVTSLDLTSLAPGQIATASLRFTPTAAQDHNGRLDIVSNVPGAKGTYSVYLRGRGLAAPVVTNVSATLVTATSARIRGKVKPNHDATSVFFQYKRTVDANWLQVPAVPVVTEGYTTLDQQYDLGGLTPATTYHYRLVAFNSVRNAADPVNGSPLIAFTTPPA